MADKSFITEKKDFNWFINFWYYYKIHMVVGIVAILFIIFALRDCAMQITPDLNAFFVSSNYLSPETDAHIESEFSSLISDINNDNRIHTNLIQHTISSDAQAQLAIATHQQIMLELKNGEYDLYFFNDRYFDLYCQGVALCDLSEFFNLPKGTYSILVQNNKYFKELTGINTTENIHLCVRTITSDIKEKNIPTEKAHRDNAIKVLKKFIE